MSIENQCNHYIPRYANSMLCRFNAHPYNIRNNFIETFFFFICRLSMCIMCGDPFPLELALGPLLNHDMCRVLADTPYCITLDIFLESSKQKVSLVRLFEYQKKMHNNKQASTNSSLVK